MSLLKVFDVAGTAMSAQSVRMNVTASNLANAGSTSGDPEQVYRARHPVFSTFRDSLMDQSGVAGVRIDASRRPMLLFHTDQRTILSQAHPSSR